MRFVFTIALLVFKLIYLIKFIYFLYGVIFFRICVMEIKIFLIIYLMQRQIKKIAGCVIKK